MRELKLFVVLLLAGILLSCAGSSEKAKHGSSGPCPEWFSNVPEDPNYLFGAATAVSRDLQIAINKAKTEGTAEIAKQIELHIQGLTKKFDEEVGLGENANLYAKFTQATKLVIDQTLRGVKVRYQDTKPEEAGWRACVLMEFNLNETNEGLIDGISKEREMYIRFRDSQTFKELEKEVEKYRQYKKEQGLP